MSGNDLNKILIEYLDKLGVEHDFEIIDRNEVNDKWCRLLCRSVDLELFQLVDNDGDVHNIKAKKTNLDHLLLTFLIEQKMGLK